MVFVFQQSKIWDGDNRVASDMPEVSIKMQKDDEAKARRKLPPAETGRDWILVRKE